MTQEDKLYLSQLTPEERKEIRAAERRVMAEVRSCQRAVMKEEKAIRKNMTDAEWFAYKHEEFVQYCKEHGLKLVSRRSDIT
jgi:Trm5-related predicted tRNA methylase